MAGTSLTAGVPDMKALAASVGGQPLRPTRGVYTLTVREDWATANVLRRLAAGARSPAGLHIGWGSFRNLDIVAARRSRCVLLFDINHHQLQVWRAVEKAILAADSALECTVILDRLLPRDPPLRQFSESTVGWLQGDMARAQSWLWRRAPERFHHVKSLFEAGRVGLAALDIRGCIPGKDGACADPFDNLARRLRQLDRRHGIRLDTLYISNIPHALKSKSGFHGEDNEAWNLTIRDVRGGRRKLSAYERMWQNLEKIAPPGTLLISAESLSPRSLPNDLQWRTRCGEFERAKTSALARWSRVSRPA